MDLRQTDLPAGDVPVEIDLGIGDARADRAGRRVRGDRCAASASARRAHSSCHNDGVDVDMEDLPDASAGTTRLLVKADIGIGSLRIGRVVRRS